MKLRLTIIAFAFLATIQTRAQNYKIDTGHSTVQIQIERFGVVDVVGRFKAVEGTISYNGDILKTTANSTIKVNSYDANNTGGETAVKSPAFLDAAKYPEIIFKSNDVISKSGTYYLQGDLTIHGVTKPIELPFTVKGPLLDLPTQKQSIAFNASITINRQDYGLNFDRQLPNGVKIIADDVKITLIILAIAE